jgi:hypothetical protein
MYNGFASSIFLESSPIGVHVTKNMLLIALPTPESVREQMATDQSKREFVRKTWLAFLGREPSETMLAKLVRDLNKGDDPIEFFLNIESCKEAQERAANIKGIPQQLFPPGHYYSPVVNPTDLKASSFDRIRKADQLLALDIDYSKMSQVFDDIVRSTSDLTFPTTRSDDYRYYSENHMYGMGDAIFLAGMIRLLRPSKIIEVGSGFSSAVVLDTLDRTPELSPELTFVEPYPKRLMELLSANDSARVKIINEGVQEVPFSTFEELDNGDILFLDTTHISKTGSDVNHEIFHILPRLKAGVVVHFHDFFDNFEYPDQWIYEENRSWNEMYLVRAFLMYNKTFEIFFANQAFVWRNHDIVQQRCPAAATNPGGGLWLRKR